MKKVIIQGDDLGYNSFCNDGIFFAYENGILTSTTVLANLLNDTEKKYYNDRLSNLINKSGLKKPRLGIGIHLNVTFGQPLSNNWPQKQFARPFKGTGKPEEWQGSAWTKYCSQFTEKQVEDEYRLQIEKGLDFFGDYIDHLDSHHYTASYQPLKDIYEQLAKEYNLAVRAEAPLSEIPVYGGDFKFSKDSSQLLHQKNIKTADDYVLKLFFNEKNPVKSMLQYLSNLPEPTTEFMFHPAKGKDADKWRQIDLSLLINPEIISFFNNNSVTLINYKGL